MPKHYVEMPQPLTREDLYPRGGHRGSETRDGLEDRTEHTTTHSERTEGVFDRGASHHNRSLVSDNGESVQQRKPAIGEGVSFSRELRTDLDDDIYLS